MALRSLLKTSLSVKKRPFILPVNTVCASVFHSRSRRNAGDDTHNSSKTEHKTGNARWTVPIGVCLTAVGTGVLMHWKSDDRRLFSVVSAARPADDSGSGGIRQKFNFVADVVEKVAPSVVSLHT